MRFFELPTPCYVIDEGLLEQNLKTLDGVSKRSGCRILLAQKAFSMFSVYPLIKKYLHGTASSGLFEARLGREEMGGETHVFSAAYREDEFCELMGICDHIVFNSFFQLELFGKRAAAAGKSVGLRINPAHSTQKNAIYDPCAPFSRLGVPPESPLRELPEFVSGLHFHTLCEQGADALESTLSAVLEKFGPWVEKVKWINFGGGHHITRPGYDLALLESCISRVKGRGPQAVYLEPGEAIALNAGFLVATVLDIVKNQKQTAILDASAACHMPDVIEMPYRPPLEGAGLPGEKLFDYILAGPTCLAGDRMGEYSFDRALSRGDRLVFGDMAIYTMVKNNTFNGMPLPAIAIRDKKGDCRVVKSFGYEDFKSRLS